MEMVDDFQVLIKLVHGLGSPKSLLDPPIIWAHNIKCSVYFE